ncbi:TPA: hypothetical protein DIV48_02995 [Candidatus Kaiserbacteria bacterium]|nr:MAG: hypothetical protein UY93_C0002G0309 [Parcubacteria group bacterium GW2011_GWA1_56_13]KKW46410.1 MAG: hypothetical protein UY97_C0006G0014 [Parcubacteria group bacterium GW2011_GWB1_57_6]HCR52584.1 hypothetical protein [Candidatus Kaiserbacteria bacterium]
MEQGTSRQRGRGSTNILFDLYFTAEDAKRFGIFERENLRRVIREAIKRVEMTWRSGFVDEGHGWEPGAMSVFESIQESHVRTETWPQDLHLQGEVQLCNYTKDNSKAAWALLMAIVAELHPRKGSYLVVERGPGRRIRVKRGGQFAWEDNRIFLSA